MSALLTGRIFNSLWVTAEEEICRKLDCLHASHHVIIQRARCFSMHSPLRGTLWIPRDRQLSWFSSCFPAKAGYINIPFTSILCSSKCKTKAFVAAFFCNMQWFQATHSYSRPAWTRSCAACCRWPCFSRGVGPDDPQRSLPTPNILRFWICNFVTIDKGDIWHTLAITARNRLFSLSILWLAASVFSIISSECHLEDPMILSFLLKNQVLILKKGNSAYSKLLALNC